MLVVCSEPEIVIEGSNCLLYTYKFTSNPSEDGMTSTESDENSSEEAIKKYSENVLEGFKNQSEYVLDVFNCGINHVLFDTDAFLKQGRHVVDWIKSQQNSFGGLEIVGEKCRNDMLFYILESLTISDNLYLNNKIDEKFRMRVLNVTESVYINDGNWINLEQLLSFNDPAIQIINSKLTSDDFNLFLLSWKNMESHMNLRFLEVYIENINADEILKNLEFEVVDFGVVQISRHRDLEETGMETGTIKAYLYTFESMGKVLIRLVVN